MQDMQKLLTAIFLLCSPFLMAARNDFQIKTCDGNARLYISGTDHSDTALCLERKDHPRIILFDVRAYHGSRVYIDTAFWKNETPDTAKELIIILSYGPCADTGFGSMQVLFFSDETTLCGKNQLTRLDKLGYDIYPVKYNQKETLKKILDDLEIPKYNAGSYDMPARFFIGKTQQAFVLRYVNEKVPDQIIDTLWPWEYSSAPEIDTIFWTDMDGDLTQELAVVLDIYPDLDTAIPHVEVLFFRDGFTWEKGRYFTPVKELTFELWPFEDPIRSAGFRATLLGEIEKNKKKR